MRSSKAEDTLAIDIYTRADAAGEPITLGLVERRLANLLTHTPDCPCGLCAPARTVRAYGVYRVAAGWSTGITRTRQRAAR